jgi:DNA-binding beta-propeller fold protein YncE
VEINLMSLINVASRVAPALPRAFIGLAIAGGMALPQALASEAGLGSGSVFTADEQGGSVSRIDLQSGKVRKIPVPVMPHNVDVSARAGLVFVVGLAMPGGAAGQSMPTMSMAVSKEDSGAAEEKEPGGELAILALNGIDHGPLATIDVGHHPAHVVPDLDGKRVFVTDSVSNSVAVSISPPARSSRRSRPDAIRMGCGSVPTDASCS